MRQRSAAGAARCLQDFGGCRFDSQCDVNEKCCENPDCGYKECQAPITQNVSYPLCVSREHKIAYEPRETTQNLTYQTSIIKQTNNQLSYLYSWQNS